MNSQEKKKLILKKISDGDKRSYNEIQADLELQIWQENKILPSVNPFFGARNNRKRTKGRIIQTVPIHNKPKPDEKRIVIGFKQVKHQLPIK